MAWVIVGWSVTYSQKAYEHKKPFCFFFFLDILLHLEKKAYKGVIKKSES